MMYFWVLLAISYEIRVVGLPNSYNMSSKDPMYAKMVFLTLQAQNSAVGSDNSVGLMETMDSQNMTQTMKAVSTLD